jgi:hypothetical protein
VEHVAALDAGVEKVAPNIFNQLSASRSHRLDVFASFFY